MPIVWALDDRVGWDKVNERSKGLLVGKVGKTSSGSVWTSLEDLVMPDKGARVLQMWTRVSRTWL